MSEGLINESQEKAVCYVRLSQDDPKNPSLSPINQEKICKNYAKEKGDEITLVYKDINRTGGNLNRNGIKQLIGDAKNDLFKRVYVKNWDRLSRDIIDMETTIRGLNNLGILVISCAGDNDPKARQVMTMAAQWELERMRDKTKQLHALKRIEGIPTNSPPLGYKMSKTDKRYVIDEEKALIVKRIFEMRKEGDSITTIAKELKMNAPTIYRMLQNRTYLGYNKYKEEWIKGRHFSIISEELFNQVNKIIA